MMHGAPASRPGADPALNPFVLYAFDYDNAAAAKAMDDAEAEASARPVRPDVATHKVRVTFFEDWFATRWKSENLTPQQLQDKILAAKARSKAALPWLKLAIFGKKLQPPDPDTGKVSPCLRWDGNVLEITGAELDYDGEQISFDRGLEMVRAMSIMALVYTSPSHTVAAPRWRVLAFTSKPCPPEL